MPDKMLRRLGCAILPLILLAAGGSTSATGAARGRTVTPGLTPRGQILWEFEALLRDNFGPKPVFVRRDDFSCAGNACGPLAQWSPYFFTFAKASGSRFRLVKRPAASFGQHAGVVLIKSKAIACGSRSHEFLIRYLIAFSFTVDCQRPVR